MLYNFKVLRTGVFLHYHYLKVPLHVDYLREQPLVLLPQLIVLEAEVTRGGEGVSPLRVVRVRGGGCGHVRVLQRGGPSDQIDAPCGHGRGGVDCADAGGGGAVGLV